VDSRQRLEELAGIFALDDMNFAVLSNHLHVVVRTRPDAVKSWSDEDMALHWWRLFPQRRDGNGGLPVTGSNQLRRSESGAASRIVRSLPTGT